MNKILRFVNNLRIQTCLNLCPMLRTLRYNLFRRNTQHINKSCALLFTSYSICDIHPTAIIRIGNRSIFGYKKYRGSRLETSLWMDEDATLEIGSDNGTFNVFHGCDYQIFKGAHLKIGGGGCTNRNVQIICQKKITIGDGCLISRDVVIRDNDGGHTVLAEGYKKTEPVHIGNHVWIGQGAMILKGVKIGDGAIIGAGAVVTGNVKPKALVMADPSRTFAKDIEWKA